MRAIGRSKVAITFARTLLTKLGISKYDLNDHVNVHVIVQIEKIRNIM